MVAVPGFREKEKGMTIIKGTSAVSLASHANFGIGPSFYAGRSKSSVRSVSDFTNLGERLAPVCWQYLRDEGYRNLEIDFPSYNGTKWECYDTIDGSLEPHEVTWYRFSQCGPDDKAIMLYVDTNSHLKDFHYVPGMGPIGNVRYGRYANHVVVDCGEASDMPVKGWRKIYLQQCKSGQYYYNQFNHGTLFYALDMPGDYSNTPRTCEAILCLPTFLEGIIDGESNDAIRNDLNAIFEEHYQIDETPERLMHDYKVFQ